VVSSGGKFIEPAHYSSARLELKEGEVTAWFHLPGRPAPEIPTAAPAAPDADCADDVDDARGADDVDDARGSDHAHDAHGADGEDRADGPGARYTVHGDMSQHSDNVYQQPVHIGRITGDAGRRKG
jgi:hypothetical protein